MVWFGLLSAALIIFAVWVDPDKTLFKSIHLAISQLKKLYSFGRIRVKNLMRKRYASKHRDETDEYSSMTKELAEI